MNLRDRNVQKLGNIGQGQPFAHKGLYSTHGSRLPRPRPQRLVVARLFKAAAAAAASPPRTAATPRPTLPTTLPTRLRATLTPPAADDSRADTPGDTP
jgi:hypothetical protein